MDNYNGNPSVIVSNSDDLNQLMATSDGLHGLNGTMMPTSIYYSLPPMPWFGMDIGGTLTKLVFFEPTDINDINNGIKRNKSDYKTLLNIR